MWIRLREVVAGALRDFTTLWRTLIATDLAFKLMALAITTPLTALFLRWLLSRRNEGVIADADIARFFFTSTPGILTLLVGATLALAFTAFEAASLMVIAYAWTRGTRMTVKSAMSYSYAHFRAIRRVAARMVIRAIAGILPFIAAVGALYLLLLRGHDINYYLSAKPPVFWVAVTLAGLIVGGFVWLAVWTITRWFLAFPLVLFENVKPGNAIAESAKRSNGIRGLIAIALAIWAASTLAIGAVSALLIRVVARVIAPSLGQSAVALIVFLGAVLILWGVVAFLIGAMNFALLALLIVRIWLLTPYAAEIQPSFASGDAIVERRLSNGWRYAVASVLILLAISAALLVFYTTRRNERVLVLAHRGSSLGAPENTLTAFRLAIDEGADMIELDVQESLDGEVLVAHDSDLMKVARSPMKIWEHTAADLRAVDVGKGERVPTFAEVLEACKGKIDVMVELKSYGHSQDLEQRVARLVEAADMQNDTAFMSLNHDMVRGMKRVRPQWRIGALAAKAVGDPSKLDVHFLAVESSVASARFVRRAHRAGQDVYVWTVNDPASMLTALSRGVDGLITDKPALAREVVDRRAKMSDAQRLLVALMLRLGVTPEPVQTGEL